MFVHYKLTKNPRYKTFNLKLAIDFSKNMDDLVLYMPKIFVNEITDLLDPKTYTIKNIAKIAETNDAEIYKKLYTKFKQYINDLKEKTNKTTNKTIDGSSKKTIIFENRDESEKERLYRDFYENQFSCLLYTSPSPRDS